MTCKNCGKDITGNFIVFNPVAFLEDRTKSSVAPPRGKKVKIDLSITCHSDNKHLYKSVDIIKNMTDCSHSTITQAEESFCSKTCFMLWLNAILKTLPNP